MNATEVKKLLADHALFEEFAASEVADLTDAGSVVTAKPGETLISEGEIGDSVCVMLTGEADVSKSGKQRAHHLATIQGVALLGEIGLLLPHPRSATVRAKEETTYFTLTRAKFEQLLDGGSTAARKLLTMIARTVAQRQRATNEKLVELLEGPEKKRAHVDLSSFKDKFKHSLGYHI